MKRDSNKQIEYNINENKEIADWAVELLAANKELVFQNEDKEKRASELFIANKELIFQNEEKIKKAMQTNTLKEHN